MLSKSRFEVFEVVFTIILQTVVSTTRSETGETRLCWQATELILNSTTSKTTSYSCQTVPELHYSVKFYLQIITHPCYWVIDDADSSRLKTNCSFSSFCSPTFSNLYPSSTRRRPWRHTDGLFLDFSANAHCPLGMSLALVHDLMQLSALISLSCCHAFSSQYMKCGV